MSYHAHNSLKILQRLIGEGSDSSSGQEPGSGQDETELRESVVENRKIKDVPVNVKSDSSVSKESGKVCRMNKMGNVVDNSQETEEELNRKYEEFLRSGHDDAGDENHREEVLEKIEEECNDVRHVAKVKSEPQHIPRVKEMLPVARVKSEPQAEEIVENNSKVVSEELNKKKIKPRKKKRKVKKVLMEQDEYEDAKPDSCHKVEEKNQENYEHEEVRPVKREESTDQESVSDKHEVMSDLGPLTQNQKRRKLVKRTQIRKFRSLDINPNLFYEDQLHQKYGELKELITNGITQHQVSRRNLRQMEVLRQQYASISHRIPPSGRAALREVSHHHQPEKSESEHAYSTIRLLQVSNRGRFSQPRPKSAAYARQEPYKNTPSRPKTAAPTRHEESRERLGRPGSGKIDSRNNNQSLRNRSYSPRNRKQADVPDSPRSKSADSDVTSEDHPHMFPHSDHQLKNTDNEQIKEWLKKKNVIIRRKKLEEKKKKREERKKEQALEMEKEKRHQESKEKVHEWLNTKRHEAIRKEKEERVHRKHVMEDKAVKDALQVTMVSGQGFHYPPSPPLYKTKHVVRPGTTMADIRSKKVPELPVAAEETHDKDEETQQTTLAHKIQVEGPHPPTTKFVYKRPVLGRVRLKARIQQTPGEQAGEKKKKFNHPVKKDESKPRKSYDEWLAEKRIFDSERRKDILRQNRMTKSNPELERIVPDNKTDNEVNKNYSEVDYLEEVTRKVVSEVLSSLEDEETEENEDVKTNSDIALKVSGSKASLSTRPKSASSAPVPSLQRSKSPRRPASAKPHSNAIKQNGEQSSQPSFKVPFPPEFGVPKHVDAMQRKLFSPKMWVNPEDGERPEPQGCDAVEQLCSTMLTEESARDCSTNLSDSMKFKRVSFCETTTVIEEEIPSTNATTPDDEEQLSSTADSEKHGMVLSNGIFITEDS